MANTKIEYAKGGSDFRTKGTISCWVKRSSLGVQQDIWSWGENNSSDAYLRFDTADNIEMHCDGAGGTFNTSSLYRDVNGWFHFVFSLDGSNATANMRRRFWINGVQIDEGSGKNDIAAFSAAVLGWHSTQDLWIGARARSQQSGDVEYFNGLMSHFHYCSNYSYAASDFGETDATTGEWKIKTSPNVQYGSEGFFLKMENSSNMDLDSSGNNKTLTTSGTLTKTEDSPSNVFCTMNPLDNYFASSTFTHGNNTVQTSTSNYTWNIGTLGMTSGKFYWEVKYSANSNSDYYNLIGIADRPTDDVHDVLGRQTNCSNYGYYSYSGGVYAKSTSINSYGNTYTVGDIIGVAVDLDNSKLYFSKNGTWQNSGVPTSGSTGTGAFSIDAISSTTTGVYFPASGDYGSSQNATNQYNFGNGYFGTTAVSSAGTNASGNGIFEYDVPTGYTALSTKGLNL